MRILSITVLLYLTIQYSTAEAAKTQNGDIVRAYQSFQYNNVISLCQMVIADSSNRDSTEIKDAYLYQGLAGYALGNMEQAFASFISLLRYDPGFTMDAAETPPKIIRFFNSIKSEFAVLRIPDRNLNNEHGSTANPGISGTSLIYSFFLPGSGHIREGQKTRGWILASASAITLASTVYYTVDTINKEKEYLNAVDKADIDQKYQAFNQSFKRRNISALLFGLVWVYTQVDLILSEPSFPLTQGGDIRLMTSLDQNLTPGLILHIQF